MNYSTKATDQRNGQSGVLTVRKWIILIIAASIVVLLIGGHFAVTEYFKHNDKQIREEYSLKDVKAVVTAEECEKSEMGMSIEEVEEIIGGKGKMSYENEYSK